MIGVCKFFKEFSEGTAPENCDFSQSWSAPNQTGDAALSAASHSSTIRTKGRAVFTPYLLKQIHNFSAIRLTTYSLLSVSGKYEIMLFPPGTNR